eukprot:TRINITY_DN3738_c0_g1_i6.p2 TRINITY_DN3738_c0_g1~~TRINITY_DN3738_c0_g1_i6.p2  ORF type:complete len:142 (-),score=33.31 TRINITY_DN3738_c0_g1_i6:528-953(-)
MMNLVECGVANVKQEIRVLFSQYKERLSVSAVEKTDSASCIASGSVAATRETATCMKPTSFKFQTNSIAPALALAPAPMPAVKLAAPNALQPGQECCVCLEHQSNTIFIPCGHLCCCSVCALKLDKCPQCRAPGAKYHVFQ